MIRRDHHPDGGAGSAEGALLSHRSEDPTNSRAGTFVLDRLNRAVYRRSAWSQAESLWIRGVQHPAQDQEGQPSRQPGLSTLEFLHLHHPMPQSGRHPHRPLPLVAFTDFAGYCEQKDPSHSRISQDRPKPLLRIRGGCGGDENRPDFSGRPSRCHLRRSDKLRPWKLSAGVRPDDSPRAAGAASGSAARAAAARCEAARRSCCIYPVASPARAASDPARGTPDSNTVPSNREDIASSRLAKRSGETPRKTGGIVRRSL